MRAVNRTRVVGVTAILITISCIIYLGASWQQVHGIFVRTNQVQDPVQEVSTPTPTPTSKPTPILNFVREHAILYRGVLMIAVADRGARYLALNWLLSLHRVGIDVHVPVVFCLDAVAYDFLHSKNVTAFLLTPEAWAEINWTEVATRNHDGVLEWATQGYLRVIQSKMVFVLYFLKHGYTVFMQDVDIVFIRRHPSGVDVAIDLLRNGPPQQHIVMSQNRNNFFEFNTGLFVARPADMSLRLFEATIKNYNKNQNLDQQDDQTVFNEQIALPHFQAIVGALPYETFLPGFETFRRSPDARGLRPYLEAHWSEEHDAQLPFSMHANFVPSNQKMKKLREWNLYFADDQQLIKDAKLT